MSRNPEWLLQQLPSGMLNDAFFRRYMSIYQTMADTNLDHIDAIDHTHIDDIGEIHGDVITHPKAF